MSQPAGNPNWVFWVYESEPGCQNLTTMDWYYTKDKMQVGPVSQVELMRKISTGEVSSHDFAWRDGVGDWRPISTFPELQGNSSAPPGVPTPNPSSFPTPSPAPPAAVRTSGLAIASFSLSIGSIILCGACFFGIFAAIPGIICGHLALMEINRSNGKLEGKVLAIIGLVLGYLITLATVVAFLIFGVAMYKESSKSHDFNDWNDSFEMETVLEMKDSQGGSFDESGDVQPEVPAPESQE